VNEGSEKFCGGCGAPSAGSRAAPQARFASPETYTPKHLAEKIMTSKTALEGERKQVTVLFADLKGSMELLADRDPEEALQLLDPVLEHMLEAVHRYEGTVNQVMGDGIMALFGAPLAHEDHAVRACYAALRMQETVKRYSEEVRRTHGIEVQIRVGLNSGEVVVRSIGSDLHMDYTAVGQTTHLAARMEQLANPGSIRLTAATLRLAEGYVEVKPLGPVPVKGLSDPVEVYEATGAGAVRSRLQAAAARGLTRFVGRDAEVEQLRKALEQARAGHGQLVAAVGEPGVGKSRLFYEFTHSHRTQDWLILESGSVSYGKATSYLPVIDLLKAYFKVHDRETHREIREKVTGKLLTLDRTLEPTLPALLSLLDVPVEDAQWQALDPPQRRRRTLDAVKRLLLRESQMQPLLVIFEDLHWIDGETGALLVGLIDSLPTARFLLLVNYRPEYQHGWGSKTYYTQLRLDALPPESADELLLALLGTGATVEALKPVLIARTGGNPLFLEESVRTLVETNVLTGERGAYQLARPLDTIDVPATVQAILASRIDRLDPPDKQLLQTASVVGKDVPFALLLAIAELPEEDLRRGLAHLQGAEFLYETSLFPDPEYTFKHALTHEVAYGGLLQQRRRTLHAHVVEAMERLYADRLGEQVDRIAYHAVRGEAWEKALGYLSDAGAKAIGRSAYHEAVTSFEKGLEVLTHLPQSRETLERAVDMRLSLRAALLQLGELGRLHDLLQEALSLATQLEDRRRIARSSAFLANYFWYASDPNRAIELSQATLAIAQTLGDSELHIVAAYAGSPAYCEQGDYRRARSLVEETLASGEGSMPSHLFQLATFFRLILLRCLAELGEFEEGTRRGEEALRIAEAMDRPVGIVHACLGLGIVHLKRGNLDEAIPALERSLSVCREWDVGLQLALASGYLGLTYALAGRVDDALALLREGIEHSASRGLAFIHTLNTAWLSEAYLLAGQGDQARKLAEEALRRSRQHRERGHEASVLRLLGDIVSRDPSRRADAEQSYREAMTRAADLGMRPLVAHCHLGLGKLYGRASRPQGAREHLTTAITMYREMDMRSWMEKAEQELKSLA
jgi:class 3 adenylate cyclase/tetratricopeptide (TPR) repeat protein